MVANAPADKEPDGGRKWALVVHHTAESELRTLKTQNPEFFADMVEELRKLAALPDPRKHSRVEPMWGWAKGWYRLAMYHWNYRIVFRLLQRDNEHDVYVEVWPNEQMPPRGDHALQIVRAACRSIVYSGDILRRRKIIGRE